ncbi:hypothetical protein KYK29_05080 [Shinella daejeonensis]|uniref:hypothetical protein n=1 Tax=Shinella daejeonensis TaxID=659017 RepID=UPI0020C79E52|nr:hypothetical protein [Shinella daejeonensis]MCP8894294.1 hypothetical protein [Shinella daejeonensis]
MARVRFIHDFDYKPTPMSTIAYKAGMELTVKRECVDKAVALGKAALVRMPRKAIKPIDDTEVDDGGRG